jgi:hypothetical protein
MYFAHCTTNVSNVLKTVFKIHRKGCLLHIVQQKPSFVIPGLPRNHSIRSKSVHATHLCMNEGNPGQCICAETRQNEVHPFFCKTLLGKQNALQQSDQMSLSKNA